jgi:hypothetical protein
MTSYDVDDGKIGVRFKIGSSIFTYPCRPDRHWDQPSLLAIGHRGLFPREENGLGVKMTTNLQTGAEAKKKWVLESSLPYVFIA